MSGEGSAATLRSPRLEWLPPLLVGASAAVAAEVALGVLLYGGTGFVRSLTTILATQGVAFGGGLWTAPRPGPDVVDRLRRRWIACLLAFLVAAVFGTLWSIMPEVGSGALGQGLGLAILAGLPLYACGALIGGLSVVAADDPGGRLAGPGAATAVGGALGFILTGFLLPVAPMPGSLLVACLVMLSTAGMVYGGVLAWRTELEVRARRPTTTGEVRVDDRHLPAAEVAERVLLDHGHVRRRRNLEGGRARPWDVAAWRTRMPDLDTPVKVLLVGGGASSAPAAILREHPLSTVDVLERTPAVVELGRDYFGTQLTIGSDDRLRVRTGNLDDLVAALDRPYDLILVDTDALGPLGGRSGLSAATVRRLDEDLLRHGGFVVWGPDRP
jgi:hypothetical protein